LVITGSVRIVNAAEEIKVGLDIRHFATAESIPGHTTEVVGQIAKKSNTADGMVIGKYRKTHIPLIESSNGENVYEKFYFRPGNLGFPVFNTPFGVKFGIIICYDRHFTETGRMVALGGAEVLFVPSATAGVTTKFWEVELQYHAITNVMYVCGVNRVGKDTGISTSREHMGGTMAVNYRGEIMAQAGNERDEIVYAELDLEQLREFRSYCGYYRDRRPSIYAAICQE